MQRIVIPLTAALLIGPLLSDAEAGAYLSLEADVVTLPDGQPTILFMPDTQIHRAEIRLSRVDGGFSTVFTVGSLAEGQEQRFSWNQPEGEFDYDVSVLTVYPDGSRNTEEIGLWVAAVGLLEAEIPPETVDLTDRTFTIHSNRRIRRVELTLLDDAMDQHGPTRQQLPADREDPTRATVTWPELASNLFQVQVKAWDDYGFWSEMDITPWSVTIPHEDVIFETGSDVIRDSEAPKLQAALRELERAVQRYGRLVEVKLYVGGYTDTVGDSGSNQSLSERRARSIAAWFQQNGFSFPIFYQGFGERALAVETGDEVDEAANRRAVYILAAGVPATSADTPSSNWRSVR